MHFKQIKKASASMPRCQSHPGSVNTKPVSSQSSPTTYKTRKQILNNQHPHARAAQHWHRHICRLHPRTAAVGQSTDASPDSHSVLRRASTAYSNERPAWTARFFAEELRQRNSLSSWAVQASFFMAHPTGEVANSCSRENRCSVRRTFIRPLGKTSRNSKTLNPL